MPDADGITVLERVKKMSPDTEVIVITGYSSIDSAIEAIKKGAYHYSVKPLKLDQIRLLAKNAIEKIRLLSENRGLREAIAQRDSITSIVGASYRHSESFRFNAKSGGRGLQRADSGKKRHRQRTCGPRHPRVESPERFSLCIV